MDVWTKAYSQQVNSWGHPEQADNVSLPGTSPGERGNPILITTVFTLILINLFFNCHFGATMTYLYHPNLRANQFLIMNLAGSSLFFVLLYFPMLLYLEMKRHDIPNCQSLCALFIGVEDGLVFVIIWSAAFVSFDHYLLVKKQSEYEASMRGWKLTLGLVFIWLTGGLLGMLTGLLTSTSHKAERACICKLTGHRNGFWQLLHGASFIALAFILPITLMLTFHGLTISATLKQMKRRWKNPFHSVLNYPGSSAAGDADSLSSQQDYGNLIRFGELCQSMVASQEVQVAGIQFLIHGICFLPYSISTLISTMDYWQAQELTSQYIHYAFLFLLFSSVNFHWLLYIYLDQRLQLFLYKLYMQILTAGRQRGVLAANRDNSSSLSSLDEEEMTVRNPLP